MSKLVRSLCMLILLIPALVACTPAATPPPPPTQDPNVIRTQAAGAIYATLTAAVTPTFTPTITPTVTDTPEPTATHIPEPTATVGTPLPTATVQIQGDAAKFLGTAPHSYVEIRPNEEYNIEFDLLNVGTTTWTTGYSLVWVGGEPFTNQRVIQLDRDVAPGQKGIFIYGSFGSEDMSAHTTVWQLYNAGGLPVPGGRCVFTYQPV